MFYAAKDIQNTIDYYNNKIKGLGPKFENAVDKEFTTLSKNPFYQIRYKDIRCKPVKKFPCLIHFHVDEHEKIVRIFAVINTHRDPNQQWL